MRVAIKKGQVTIPQHVREKLGIIPATMHTDRRKSVTESSVYTEWK